MLSLRQVLFLSPVLYRSYDQLLRPNSGRRASLPSLFEDSLPDGWGRLLLDREIAARGISRTKIGDIERLAYVGRYGSGALTYAPKQTLFRMRALIRAGSKRSYHK